MFINQVLLKFDVSAAIPYRLKFEPFRTFKNIVHNHHYFLLDWDLFLCKEANVQRKAVCEEEFRVLLYNFFAEW